MYVQIMQDSQTWIIFSVQHNIQIAHHCTCYIEILRWPSWVDGVTRAKAKPIK